MTEQTFSEHSTPAGIEIRYHWAPKRKYEIRPPDSKRVHGEPEFDWLEAPSVTTVLEVLDKAALTWWGMTVGIQGVLDLYRQGVLRPYAGPPPALIYPGPVGEGVAGMVIAGQEQITRLLIREKLTVNHVKSTAGDRGQSCHDAFEIWCKEGTKPDPEMFPPEERGYILGLLEFIRDMELGGVESEGNEIVVGSLEHGYAGRYDVRLKTTKPCNIVKRVTPKKGRQYAELPAGRVLSDVKTSKYVYPESHFRQLEAYEGASVECGFEPTDHRGVIHIHPGDPNDDKVPDFPHYEFVRSTATLEDFLCVLAVYRSNEAIKGRK